MFGFTNERINNESIIKVFNQIKFTNRKDIVIKKILRDMRKYYKGLFLRTTSYHA